MNLNGALILLSGFLCLMYARPAKAAQFPTAEISNQHIRAKLYLPDAKDGFYRSTRFDWSGAIASLEYQGHNYYGPWFTKHDPSVPDFIYSDADIVVGSASAMTGPVEEFQRPLGYDTAKAGETFIKIGVGILRRPDDAGYTFRKQFELVDPGKWTVKKGKDFVTYVQEIADPASGYSYRYTKTVQLTPGKPEMVIEHTLSNTGRLPIATNVYDHNFLVLDQMAPGPDYTITLPFQITSTQPPSPQAAEIRGNQITYVKTLEGQERVSFPIQGFGPDSKDYDIRIEHKKTGAGLRITGDRPLTRESLWSIRSVLAIEPLIDVKADPGKDFTWKYTYTYFTLSDAK